MQTEAADVVDLSRESEQTRAMYGIDNPQTKSFGTKCLMARRLIEEGVRFVQIYSDGEWDAHTKLTENHLLGIDHERPTYFHTGRSFRLTDVAGQVLHPILS